ncbi:hypothetical protein IKT18_00605 [Candidatus Saccharibacteria bacterium]|nr:hypothetical protein [Candidatus Saccharibacteria bacterium]
MTGIQRNFKITSGPDRDELFTACKYAYEKGVVFPVQFVITHYTRTTDDDGKKSVVPKLVTDIKVVGIEHDSGNGQVFKLRGYCKVDIRPLENNDRMYKFHAQYNTQSRRGTITLE